MFLIISITRYLPTCFGHLCDHLQGDINKNTFTKVSEPFHHWQ